MTDKLRDAAQVVKRLEPFVHGMGKSILEELKEALTQQDAHKKHKPLFAEMIAQHPGLAEELAQQGAQVAGESLRDLAAKYIAEDEAAESSINRLMTLGRKMADAINAAPTPPAQQDAQAVAQDEIVAAWKSGMTVQYFVTIGHDDEWTDYTNPTPPDTSGTRLAWRVKPGQRSNAAPTPPARATLTARELLNMMPESIPAEHDNALLEYARDIIEAYKQKNGIK